MLMAINTDIPSINFENIYEVAKGMLLWAIPPSFVIVISWTKKNGSMPFSVELDITSSDG
jgi:hypothetical protein